MLEGCSTSIASKGIRIPTEQERQGPAASTPDTREESRTIPIMPLLWRASAMSLNSSLTNILLMFPHSREKLPNACSLNPSAGAPIY